MMRHVFASIRLRFMLAGWRGTAVETSQTFDIVERTARRLRHACGHGNVVRIEALPLRRC
jgi:hypothetical protein